MRSDRRFRTQAGVALAMLAVVVLATVLLRMFGTSDPAVWIPIIVFMGLALGFIARAFKRG